MKRLLRNCLIFSALLFALSDHAYAVDVFGIELSTTSLSAFLEKKSADATLRKLPVKQGYIKTGYSIETPDSAYPSLRRAGFMFDRNDMLCMVLLELSHDEFDTQAAQAKKLYKLTDEDSSTLIHRRAYFSSGSDKIQIDSESNRPYMYIMFMNEGFKKEVDARNR